MLGILGGILGGIAGAQGSTSRSGVNLAAPSASELAGEQAITTNMPVLQQLINAGAGQQDVTAGLGAQRGLGDLLAQYAQGGFLPGEQDWSTARQFASAAFQPQQVAMQQAFQEQNQRTAQLAAQLGRPVNDPILQAKLAQEQMRGAERLGAAQSAYSSEFAQSLPQQRLGYMGQLADVRSQLASQAMSNRQALIGLGSNLEQAGRSFRAQTAERYQTSGGGLGGAISGALGGFGAFSAAAPALGQAFGGIKDFFGSLGASSGGSGSYTPAMDAEWMQAATLPNKSAALSRVGSIPQRMQQATYSNVPTALMPSDAWRQTYNMPTTYGQPSIGDLLNINLGR